MRHTRQRRILGRLLLLALGFAPGLAKAEEPPVLSSYVSTLEARAVAKRLYDQRRWLLLLHDRPDGRGGFESEADGPKFFLAPDGKTDPRAELLATLDAFATPGDPAACRFVARWKWLSQELAFDPALLPAPSCRDYEEWRAQMDAGSISLVFASAFIGSPASTYGHTFLRIDKKSAPSPLLAMAIEFAANPTTYNPILYSIYGLGGGFRGRFFSRVYFSKVQEYSNLESRELWEYRLALDEDQVDWALRHLWELDVTWFDYYFASENCSYQLLTVLDVAAPQARLAEKFPQATIPADTVKAIVAAGLVAERIERPSQQSVMLARRDALTRPEVRMAESIASPSRPVSPPGLQALPAERQALVLDAAFDLFKHRHGFFSPRAATPPEAIRRREEALSFERSLVKIPGVTPAIPPGTPPEDSHASSRAGAGPVHTRSGDLAEIDWRIALHDVLDVQDGYPADTELEMISARVRIDESRMRQKASFDAVLVERFDAVRIVSLTPRDRWVHPLSWRFWFGGGRVPDAICRGGWGCTAADVQAGVGEAVGAEFPFHTVWYAFVDANPAAGPAFRGGWRVGALASAGTLWAPSRHLRVRAEASVRWDPLGDRGPGTRFDPVLRHPSTRRLAEARPDSRIESTASFAFGKNRELRGGATWVRGQPEASAVLLFLY